MTGILNWIGEKNFPISTCVTSQMTPLYLERSRSDKTRNVEKKCVIKAKMHRCIHKLYCPTVASLVSVS